MTGVGLTGPAGARARWRTTIQASTGLSLGLHEFWRCRRLLYVLVWRDLKVRYKQTLLGATWIVLQPLLSMAVLTLVFGRLARVPSEGVPYPLFVFCGLLPWQLFAQSLVRCGNSLVEERYLLAKMYIPHLVLPVSDILGSLPDFAVNLLILIFMMWRYGYAPTSTIVAALPALLMILATALGVGLVLATLNVRFRDVSYTVPFFIQLWFFMTPVAYPASMVPERWRFLYGLNPIAGAVEEFRRALLGTATVQPMRGSSAIAIILILGLGLLYFQSRASTFADVI